MFQQRHLNFNKFLQERAQEISKFRDILKLQTKKKGHQALPKCIRRRAMSHNRYRIPSKMRKNNEQQLIKAQNMQRIPKCRKHIRKRSRLIFSYKQRHSKIKWLSTHLWAAKRMRMISYHGYKVAQTPNQKAFRSSYRHFRHNCCMIDLSFYQCLKLDCQNNFPENILIQQNDSGKKILRSYKLNELHTNRTYNGYCFTQQKRLICPMIIFNCGLQSAQSQSQIIRCFFHPAALLQIQKQFPNGNQISKCKSQLYCLIGPQWNVKLLQAIKIYGIDTSEDQMQKLKFNPNSSSCFGSTQKFKIENIPYSSTPIGSLIKQNYNSAQVSNDIRTKTLKLFELLKNNNKSNNKSNQKEIQNQFWQQYSSIQPLSDQITFKITTRSKYTHKRKNKLSKQNKRKVIELQSKKRQLITSKKKIANISEQQADSVSQMIEQSLQNIKNQIKQIFIEQKQIKPQKQTNKQSKSKVNPILIASFKKEQLYQGCLVLCSDQDSCRFWRILSKLNIKIIGLQQFNHINLESMNMNFPQNYINTRSFQNYSQQTSQKLYKKIKYRPPQKRINFIKINSHNPLSLIQNPLIQKSFTIFIQMVNKGRCASRSYIYQLMQEDISLIQNQMSQKGSIGIVLSQTNLNQNTGGFKRNDKYFDYKTLKMSDLHQRLGKLASKRRLIGRVLTGGQGGIGYVSGQIGVQLNSLKYDGYVLIRKATSPHYYLGQITKIYDNLVHPQLKK